MGGYVKVYRKLLDNPLVCKDADHLAVWLYLLLHATHREHAELFRGEKLLLKPGQLLTGRKAIAAKLKLNENKVQRILKTFEKEQQIEQQASNKNRLITICKWQEYQSSIEQQDEQPLNNKRTTAEQQLNTYKNDKNVKNDKNEKKIEIDAAASKPAKQKYGEYGHVLLTQAEAERFASEYGQDGLAACIKILDEYIETSGKRYKNHNLVLRGWVMDRYQEDLRKRRSRPQVSGSGDDFLANLAKALEADGHG